MFVWLLRACYYGAAVAVFVLIGYQLHRFLYRSDYFQLRSVELSGAADELRAEALALGGFQSDRPLNLVELQPRRAALQIQEHPKIKSAAVSKIYPDRVQIAVEERRPAAIVVCKELYLIDAERIVLAKIKPGELAQYDFPFISGIPSPEINLGGVIDAPGLENVLETIQQLQRIDPKLYAQFSEFALNEHKEVTAIMLDGLEVRFGRHHPLSKMPELELFLKRQPDTRNFAYVDLRFSNQIVYLPKENE